MHSALFSNPNWDDEKNNREERLKALDKSFNEAIELVYGIRRRERDVDWNNPFYAAAKRGLERTREKYSWALEGKTMNEVVPEMSQEQLRAREESRRAIDQLR